MVWGTPELEIGVRSEGSHVGTCGLANLTEVFPEANSLVSGLFNTGAGKQHTLYCAELPLWGTLEGLPEMGTK